MKILLINYEYPPVGAGAASFCRLLAHRLAEQGNAITVLTSRYGDLKEFEQEAPRLAIYRIPVYRKSLHQCTVRGMLSFIFQGLRNLDRVVRACRPDICLNFFAIPCGPLALYIKKKYQIPYVLCLRGGDVPGFSPEETGRYHRMLAPLSRLIWDGAARITANSRGLKELAEKFHATKDIETICNGIDTTAWRPMPGAPDRQTFHILFVGRLAPQKNLVNLFCRGIPELLRLDTGNRIRFTIVGDGPLKQTLQDIARSVGYLSRLEFAGWQAREKLPAIYNAHDLLVLPSLYEGMSNAALEAKACGLTVAGFRIAGNDELFEKERDILVETDDFPGLAQAIHKTMSAGGGERVISKSFANKFGMERITDQYLELLTAAGAEGNSRLARQAAPA